MRDSTVFLRSYYESISKMPRKYRLEAYEAFCNYAFNGTVPEEMSDRVSSLFVLMKPTVDSAAKRYRAAVENGKKGGRPRKTEKAEPENPSETQSKPDGKPKRNLNVDEDDDADEDADADADDDVNEDADADVVVVGGDLSTADEFSTREEELFEEDDDEGAETVLSYLDGTKIFISREEVKQWREAYPDLEVELELRKMQIWLDNHPKRQKSSGGRHFIVSWLNHPPMEEKKTPESKENDDAFDAHWDEFFDAATCKGEEETQSGDR